MAAIALWLYLFYVLTAFGLRGLAQFRRTGSTGFRGVGGRPGSWEWCGGVLFALALVAAVAAPALQLAGVLTPLALIAIVGLVVAIEIQVRVVEEPYLLGTHGRTYRDYAARVGRFLPGLGRLSTVEPGERR